MHLKYSEFKLFLSFYFLYLLVVIILDGDTQACLEFLLVKIFLSNSLGFSELVFIFRREMAPNIFCLSIFIFRFLFFAPPIKFLRWKCICVCAQTKNIFLLFSFSGLLFNRFLVFFLKRLSCSNQRKFLYINWIIKPKNAKNYLLHFRLVYNCTYPFENKVKRGQLNTVKLDLTKIENKIKTLFVSRCSTANVNKNK